MAFHFRCTARRVAMGGLVLLSALALGGPLAAARPEALSAAAPGKIVDLPAGRGEGELLRLDAQLVPALLALAPEEGAAVLDWPFAPGVRRAVRVERHEVWAEGAKVFRVDAGGRTEIPRSSLVFFWGGDTEGAGARVLVVVDPSTRALTALAHGPEGVHEIARDPGGRRGPPPPRGSGAAGRRDHAVRPGGLPGHGLAAGVRRRSRGAGPDGRRPRIALQGNPRDRHRHGVPRLVRKQHDDDDELHRDARREHQRHVRARPEPPPRRRDDVPPDGHGPVDGDGLGRERQPAERVHEHTGTRTTRRRRIRGRSAPSSRARARPGLSGIAWVAGSVCGSGSDYSFNQISANGSWLWGDTLIVGHEIGHNMGSPHTHCYSNPAPDRCYAGEGCYSGATSCPASQTINGVANVTGTLMSYCHLSGFGRVQLVPRLPPAHGHAVTWARRSTRAPRPRASRSWSLRRHRHPPCPRRRASTPSRRAACSTRATRPGRSARRRSGRSRRGRSSPRETATSRRAPSRSPRTSRS